MSDVYKLLLGDNTHVLETFTEQANKNTPKKMYLEGIFGEAGRKNKNNRIYDPVEMERDIERYNVEFIASKRAYNELNHPSTPDVDLERACDRTVSLRMENDGTIYGKALILDTPLGRIQKALIEGGGMIGKSSRAMGQISERRSGDADYVNSLRLVCFDSVQDPSVGSAIVDPLMESREWIIGDDGSFLKKPFDGLQEKLEVLPKSDRDTYIVNAVVSFLDQIKC